VTEQPPSIACYRPSIGFHRPAIGYAIAPAIGLPSGAIGLSSIAPYPRADRTAAFGACGARLPSAFRASREQRSARRNSATSSHTVQTSMAVGLCRWQNWSAYRMGTSRLHRNQNPGRGYQISMGCHELSD
jgi:hypothetical protein